jgi:uncharacterized membrane protein
MQIELQNLIGPILSSISVILSAIVFYYSRLTNNKNDVKEMEEIKLQVAVLDERIANENILLEKLEDKIDKLMEE